MAISPAQFAAMPRRTPSGIAEEAYQAAHPRRAIRAVVGPAGITIPQPNSVYATTSQGPLLRKIAGAAYMEWKAQVVPAALEAEAVAVLHASLLRRWPQTDMEVLRRHGFASVRGQVDIEAGRYGLWRAQLPQPMLMPNGGAGFHTSDRGSGEPVPTAALPWCDALAHAADAKNRDFLDVQTWPGRFKQREGRWPLWREIETAWPRIADWMAGERAAAR